MSNRPICCKPGCDREADYEIVDTNEPRSPEAFTQACVDHVGALLGSLPPTKPTGPWSVYPLAALEADHE